MLRLLPERFYAGLLGDGVWLARGARSQPLSEPPSIPAEASLAERLESLLHASTFKLKSAQLSIMLPSQVARCVSLPWSPHLRSGEEKKAYAAAHLEQAGFALEGHAVHAEFRHYGAQGFAYAVSQELLEQLYAAAATHSLELTTALPVVAITHMAAQPARSSGLELTLVIEDAAVSALVVDRAGLQRYDAEPTIGGRHAAVRRLITRLSASATEFKGATMCVSAEDDVLMDIVGSLSPQMGVRSVRPHEWRRYL